MFLLTYFLCTIFIISGCKKDDADKSAEDSEFSFSYNGNKYVMRYKEGATQWTVNSASISINRPDIFEGYINFPYAECAYFTPAATGQTFELSTDCQLTASGLPVDSAAVYFYQSGGVELSYEVCQEKKEYDVFTGSYVTGFICDTEGTFNLTLKNRENKTIVITDGKFRSYKYRRN